MKIFRDPFLVVVLLANLALGASILTRGHEWGDDWASYVMQAQSILNGNMEEFIERNEFTITESSFQIGPVAYPWGYPLALTPALLLKGVHALTLKLPGLFFYAAFLICLYLLTESRLAQTERVLFVSLFAFNPALIGFLDQIASDIPFLFFASLALYVMIKHTEKAGVWNAILLGTVFFLPFFFRTTGIILLASFLIHQTIRFYREKNERKAIVISSVEVALTFGSFVLVSTLIFPNGQSSYFAQLEGLSVATIRGYASGYFSLLGGFFGTSREWAYALTPFFVIGAGTQWRKDQPLIVFFSLYFSAIILWPVWQGMRFIFPLIPVFVYFIFQGINFIVSTLKQYRAAGRYAAYIFWLGVILIFFYTAADSAYRNLQNDRQIGGPFDSYSKELYEFIKEKTPRDSVIVFFKPRAMRLMTDRDSFMSTECERLPLGNYVAISKKAENSQLSPYEIDDCGIPLKSVFENRRFIVYQIQK